MRVPVAFQLDQLQKGQAALQLINLLLVLGQPGGDGGDGAPQAPGFFVELLGLVDRLSAGVGLAEQGVGLLLEAIAAFDLIEERPLVLLLLALTLEGPLEALLEALLPLAEGSGLQAALVIGRQLGIQAGG